MAVQFHVHLNVQKSNYKNIQLWREFGAVGGVEKIEIGNNGQLLSK